ncbi:11039_t:CDS:2, partial [Ambispora leptoticha]
VFSRAIEKSNRNDLHSYTLDINEQSRPPPPPHFTRTRPFAYQNEQSIQPSPYTHIKHLIPTKAKPINFSLSPHIRSRMCVTLNCFSDRMNNQSIIRKADQSSLNDEGNLNSTVPTKITTATSEHLDQGQEKPKEKEGEKETNHNDTMDNNTIQNASNSYVDLTIQRDYPFTIATAASENHFCVLQSWIYNAQKILHGLNNESFIPRIIIYDLGLLNYQRSILKSLHTKGFFTELRQFNYTKYPDFWNVNKGRGEYAWKTGIVAEIAKDFPGIVVWLDSGSIFKQEFLINLQKYLDSREGFLSGKSIDRIPTWTHAGTFKYFHVKPARFRNYRNCNGAMIVFDTTKVQSLIDAWYKCALVKDCIAPEGSNRYNHRQDQAVLSLLAAMESRRCSEKPEFYGVVTHQDHQCVKHISNFEKIHPDLRWVLTDEEIKEFKEYAMKNLDSDEFYNILENYN